MDLASLPVTASPLKTYPKGEDEWLDLLHTLYRDMMSFLVEEDPEASSFALFVTKDIKNIEATTGIKLKSKTKGSIVVMKEIKDDSLFYLTAVLKADAFVKLLEPNIASKDSYDVMAVWQRELGLNAVKWIRGDDLKDLDSHVYEELDEKAVSHILPGSIIVPDMILMN